MAFFRWYACLVLCYVESTEKWKEWYHIRMSYVDWQTLTHIQQNILPSLPSPPFKAKVVLNKNIVIIITPILVIAKSLQLLRMFDPISFDFLLCELECYAQETETATAAEHPFSRTSWKHCWDKCFRIN